MRRVIAGGILMIAILTLSALLVPMVAANRDVGAQTSSQGAAPAGQAAEDQDKTPFIGVMIVTLSADEASTVDLEGGVKVVKVLDDGPSAGVLEAGDVITAIGGTETMTAQEVVDVVKASEPGAALSITVRRGAETLALEVTVGERDVATPQIARPKIPVEKLAGLYPNFVTYEITVETDEGYKTYSGARGTASNIDVDAGTFDLAPKDGSDAISYQISTTTSVFMGKMGNLGGLDTEQETVVLSEDGTVTYVLQGKWANQRVLPKQRYTPKIRMRGRFDDGDRMFQWRSLSRDELPPEIMELLREMRIDVEEIERRHRGEAPPPQLPAG